MARTVVCEGAKAPYTIIHYVMFFLQQKTGTSLGLFRLKSVWRGLVITQAGR